VYVCLSLCVYFSRVCLSVCVSLCVCVFYLLLFVAYLAGFSTLGAGSGMSDFPSFFLDRRLYMLGPLFTFSPLLSSFIWMSMRNSSYADWVKWGNGEVSPRQWIYGSRSSSSPSSLVTRLFWRGVWIFWSSLSLFLCSLGIIWGALLFGLLKLPLLSTFWGFLYVGFPSTSNLSILVESDFSNLVTSSTWGRETEEPKVEASDLFLGMSLSGLFLSRLAANILDYTSWATSFI